MKIIKLIFSNLNSLKGTWQIDFDTPQFVQSGIFAIIGETGAGKTTILDAICLAIYGATPRLGKITASNNDIMNTQSGECSAEVILSASGKQYLFGFQQRRARTSPTGKLQDPKREVSEIDSDGNIKLVADKLSQVEVLSGEILGMDFNQFTRSVLLAQGKFNEFLNAKSEERGELLEKITGTQIYSQIGKLAYDTYKAKKDELSAKTHRLNDIPTLSEEELAQLHSKLQEQQQQKNTLQTTQNRLSQQLTLLYQYVSTTQKIQTQKQTLDTAKTALADFEPDNQKLTLAQKAQSLHSQFVQLNHALDAHHASWQRLTDLQNALPTLQDNAKNSLTHLDTSKNALDNAQNALASARPVISEVQALEKILTSLNERHTGKKNELANLNQTFAQKSNDEKDIKNTQLDLKKTLEQEQILIAKTAHLTHLDGNIHTPLSDWQNSLNRLMSDFATFKSLHESITQLRLAKSEQQNQLDQLNNQLGTHIKQKHEQETFLTDACQLPALTPNALNDYLNHKNTQIIELDTTQKDLARLIKSIKQTSEPAKILQNQATQASLHQEIADTKQQADNLNQALLHAKAIYEQTAQKHELTKQIHALQDHLHALQDGEPCPLCGSLSHPKKATAPTQNELDQSKQELSYREVERDECQRAYANALNVLHAKELSLNQTIAQHEELRLYYKTAIDSHQQAWQQLVSMLTPFVDLPENTNISRIFDELHQTLNQTSLIDILKNLHKRLDDIKDEHKHNLDKLSHSSQLYQQICQEIAHQEHALALVQQKSEQFDNNLSDQSQKTKDTMKELTETLLWLGEHGSVIDSQLVPILQVLDDKLLDTWQACQQSIHALSGLGKITSSNLPTFYERHQELLDIDALSLHGKVLQVLKELDTAQKTHQQQQHTLAQHTLKFEALSSTLHALQGDIRQLNQQIHACQTDINSLEDEQKTITHKCQSLIGNTSLQAFADNLNQAIDTAKASFDTAKDTHTKEQNLLDTQHRLIQDENERLNRHQTAKDALSDEFGNALKDKGFLDIDDYKKSLMSEEDLQALFDKKQTLNQAHTLAQSTLEGLQDEEFAIKQSHEQSFGKIDIHQLPQLENQKTALTEQIEALLSTLGADNEKYQQAQQSLALKHTLQDDIAKDEKQLDVWRHLSELIGCSTGKSYRNYVQSLSLDILLSHANHALSRITDRYTLIQHAKSDTAQKNTKASLEVEVIDHYQGEIVRSSKNLSGGESFMVSLALALGLSGLNSQKIQIESLFLDEGFGTLDEETLDVALTALSELEQSGKTIGIISHVTTLKERIDTQIIAQKGARGISILKGAGVCQIKT